MNWTLVIVMIVIVGIGAVLVAMWWWKLAAKAAPYQDERRAPADPRQHSHAGTTADRDQRPRANIVVVRKDAASDDTN